MSSENYFDGLKSDASFSGDRGREVECFKRYDTKSQGILDPDDFSKMCEDLFVSDGRSLSLTPTETQRIFEQLDENKDGRIDKEEFHILWRYWLPMILRPRSALIVVDVQNDFIDGSLAVGKAADIVPVINRLVEDVSEFEQVVYTFDWHPEDHVSFHENISKRELHPSSPITKEHACLFDTVVFDGPVVLEQTLWPTHCVQHSHGAQLHPDLKIAKNHTNIYKGSCNHIDSYSAFFDNKRLSQTELTSELCSQRITDVYVCGLALDVCVRHTAIDALHLGFRTVLVEDGTRGITEDSSRKAVRELEDAGCIVVLSEQVKSFATGKTRHPKMALKAAVNVAEARRKAKSKLASMQENVAEKMAPLTNGSQSVSLLDL